MRKIYFSLVFSFTLLSLIGCSKDLDQNSQSLEKTQTSIVSPNGYFVAKDSEDLKKLAFNDSDYEKIKIINYEFLNLKNTDGAAMIVNYSFNNESKNIALVVGHVKTSYKSSSVEFKKLPSTLRGAPAATYKCSGFGSCYVGGEMDLNTNTATFYCKCEGNPSQNSSCTLTVTNTP